MIIISKIRKKKGDFLKKKIIHFVNVETDPSLQLYKMHFVGIVHL